ncbi:MAG: VanW family protein [Patescibacteria group bacterium]|nr:VanW family protein [Patescibacteria group bacterium]
MRYARWFVLACIVCASALVAGVLGAYQWQYRGRVYPGVSVAGLVADGLTPAQLNTLLVSRRDALLQSGLWLDIGGEMINLPLEITSSDPDLARVPVEYDVTAAVNAAYRVGRGGTLWSQLVEPMRLRWISQEIAVPPTMDESAIRELLYAVLGNRETPPLAAALEINALGTVRVLPERDGSVFDYDAAVTEVKRRLADLDTSPIPLRMTAVPAPIRVTETEAAFAQAQMLVGTTTPAFTFKDRRWNVDAATFQGWLEFQRSADPPAAGQSPVVLGFNAAAVAGFLAPIAAEVDVAPQDAKLRLENGKVVEFQVSRDGIALDIPSTTQRMAEVLLGQGGNVIPLAVTVAPAKIATGDVNDLGIRELLGVGTSNAAGSPKNRWHNIRIGVNTLNGILIAPGEEFSLIKALGEVDKEHGYLAELVIKGDRTVPEFGGGLCQIGTTVFRVALHSGLPITERQNHSFRIRYYNPAGMDATIYDPKPDFRFLNDTGHSILFLAEIKGDDLVFSFYGTNDGRIIEVPEKATILSSISSGPVRYIETDELKPGEKRLVEKPAPGGSTVFDYKVTYPDGHVNEQEFKSFYRPWPETWLVGKTPSSTDATIPPASS